MSTRKYLGDGAFFDIDGGVVELFTTDGIVKQGQVFLGPEELVVFLRCLAQHFDRDKLIAIIKDAP